MAGGVLISETEVVEDGIVTVPKELSLESPCGAASLLHTPEIVATVEEV